MYEISKDQYIYAMSRDNPPVLEVDSPARVVFATGDCFGGQIQDEETSPKEIDFSRINPATGPLYVKGLKKGDLLEVFIASINVHSPAVTVAIPGAGIFGEKITTSSTRILPIEDGEVIFGKVSLPLRKMVGVLGVAPVDISISCGTPGSHGGNMDCLLIGEGSRVYLPVFHPGALLAMGDLHAVMGDGEIMVSGAEVSGEVTVDVQGRRGLTLKNPLIETREVLATIGSAEDLNGALLQAVTDMQELLSLRTGMELEEAGMLMSLCGEARICQVVDPLQTARFEMPWTVLNQLGFSLFPTG